jgi:hypothetical protein
MCVIGINGGVNLNSIRSFIIRKIISGAEGCRVILCCDCFSGKIWGLRAVGTNKNRPVQIIQIKNYEKLTKCISHEAIPRVNGRCGFTYGGFLFGGQKRVKTRNPGTCSTADAGPAES